MKNKDLEKLLNTFKKGSEQAFDRLYEETKIPVYYTILSIVKDESLAEDLMQDTYIKMINQLDKYQKKGQFLAWLKTIARNTALNEYNKRKKEIAIDISEDEMLLGSTTGSQENRYEVQELLNHLREDEKEIVVRHVVYGETHKVIAKTMDKPLGTVLWAYRNALKKLKKLGGDSYEKK